MSPLVAQQRTLEEIIRKVIAGKIKRSDKVELAKIAKTLEKRGARGIILGCTEFPLVFPKRFDIPVFNSLEILARALLRKSYK